MYSCEELVIEVEVAAGCAAVQKVFKLTLPHSYMGNVGKHSSSGGPSENLYAFCRGPQELRFTTNACLG